MSIVTTNQTISHRDNQKVVKAVLGRTEYIQTPFFTLGFD